MPGQTCGATRVINDVSQEYEHHLGLLSTTDHAALVFMLAIRESIDSSIRNHSLPNEPPGMSTTHASKIHTPAKVSKAEASPHGEI